MSSWWRPIKWEHFPHYWPFVRGIRRSPVDFPHEGALMFPLICTWTNGWINNRDARWFETPLRSLWRHCNDPCNPSHSVEAFRDTKPFNFIGFSISYSGTIHWDRNVILMILSPLAALEVIILHYNDVIMSLMAFDITSLTIVYSTVYSVTDQRKHQSSASLAFVRGIHRWPVNSPHKGPVTRKMFPFDDVIMDNLRCSQCQRFCQNDNVSVSVYLL